MFIKQFRIKKITTNVTLLVVALFSAISLATTVISSSAQAASYVDVSWKDWSFTYLQDRNIIVGTSGSRVAIYNAENDTRWKQAQDYYAQSGGIQCGSHIDKKTSPAGRAGVVTVYTLYEDDKGTCSDDEYWQNNIDMSTTPTSAVLAAAASVNYGKIPYGCPGYSGPATGTYICPQQQGAVVNGVYKAGQAGVDEANGVINQTAGDESGESGQTAEGSCSDALSPFGWIFCPILGLAGAAYEYFVGWVQDVLFFDTNKLEGVNGEGDLREVVNVFIRIANALLVLFAIAMIAGQIFNFEILSAYTLKKMLPRIFIGAIAIQFSWFIVGLFIQLVNAIGTGIYGLLLVPFGYSISDGYVTLLEVFDTATSGSGGGNLGNAAGLVLGGLGVSVAIGAAVATGAWLSIVLTVIGVLISLLVALITLIVRQVILIVLIAIAPLAIALWIFPGTVRFWDMWWKAFSRLLMMYPLIMLLLAAGTMSAHILLASNTGGVSEIAAIIAFFAPIFMISMTYKFAGAAFGAVASLSNRTNSKLRGSGMLGLKKAADNSKASRQYNRKQRGLSLANGAGVDNAFTRRTGALGRGVNRLTRTGAGRALGRYTAGTAGASGSYADKLRQSERTEDLKNATEEINSLSQAMNPGDVRDFQTDFLNAPVGGTIQAGPNGPNIRVTQRLKEAMVLQALTARNHDAVDQYRTSVAGTDAGQSFNRLVNQNYPAFDELMPDVTRGQAIGRVAPQANNPLGISSSSQKAVSSYSKIGGARQGQVRALIDGLRNGSFEENQVAAGYLNTIANDQDVSDADIVALSQHTGLDLNAVRTSKGKVTLQATATGITLAGQGPQEVTIV